MIAKTFTDSFVEVQKLVDNFHRHIDEYLKPKYKKQKFAKIFLINFLLHLVGMFIITKIQILTKEKLKLKSL